VIDSYFFYMIVCLHVIKSINILVKAAMLVGWLVGSLDAYPNDHPDKLGSNCQVFSDDKIN